MPIFGSIEYPNDPIEIYNRYPGLWDILYGIGVRRIFTENLDFLAAALDNVPYRTLYDTHLATGAVNLPEEIMKPMIAAATNPAGFDEQAFAELLEEAVVEIAELTSSNLSATLYESDEFWDWHLQNGGDATDSRETSYLVTDFVETFRDRGWNASTLAKAKEIIQRQGLGIGPKQLLERYERQGLIETGRLYNANMLADDLGVTDYAPIQKFMQEYAFAKPRQIGEPPVPRDFQEALAAAQTCLTAIGRNEAPEAFLKRLVKQGVIRNLHPSRLRVGKVPLQEVIERLPTAEDTRIDGRLAEVVAALAHDDEASARQLVEELTDNIKARVPLGPEEIFDPGPMRDYLFRLAQDRRNAQADDNASDPGSWDDHDSEGVADWRSTPSVLQDPGEVQRELDELQEDELRRSRHFDHSGSEVGGVTEDGTSSDGGGSDDGGNGGGDGGGGDGGDDRLSLDTFVLRLPDSVDNAIDAFMQDIRAAMQKDEDSAETSVRDLANHLLAQSADEDARRVDVNKLMNYIRRIARNGLRPNNGDGGAGDDADDGGDRGGKGASSSELLRRGPFADDDGLVFLNDDYEAPNRQQDPVGRGRSDSGDPMNFLNDDYRAPNRQAGARQGGNGPLSPQEFMQFAQTRHPELEFAMAPHTDAMLQAFREGEARDGRAVLGHGRRVARVLLDGVEREVADRVDQRALVEFIVQIMFDHANRDDDASGDSGGSTPGNLADIFGTGPLGPWTVGISSLSQLIGKANLQSSQITGLMDPVHEALLAGRDAIARERAVEMARVIIGSVPSDPAEREIYRSEVFRIQDLIIEESTKALKDPVPPVDDGAGKGNGGKRNDRDAGFVATGRISPEEFISTLSGAIHAELQRRIQGIRTLMQSREGGDNTRALEELRALTDWLCVQAEPEVAREVNHRQLEDYLHGIARDEARPTGDDDGSTDDDDSSTDDDDGSTDDDDDAPFELQTIGVDSLSQLIKESRLQDGQAADLMRQAHDALLAGDDGKAREHAITLTQSILPADPPPDEEARKRWLSEFTRIRNLILEELAKGFEVKKTRAGDRQGNANQQSGHGQGGDDRLSPPWFLKSLEDNSPEIEEALQHWMQGIRRRLLNEPGEAHSDIKAEVERKAEELLKAADPAIAAKVNKPGLVQFIFDHAIRTLDYVDESSDSDSGDDDAGGAGNLFDLLPERVHDQVEERFRDIDQWLGATRSQDGANVQEDVRNLAVELRGYMEPAVAEEYDIQALEKIIFEMLEQNREAGDEESVIGDDDDYDDDTDDDTDDASPPRANLGEIFGTGPLGPPTVGVSSLPLLIRRATHLQRDEAATLIDQVQDALQNRNLAGARQNASLLAQAILGPVPEDRGTRGIYRSEVDRIENLILREVAKTVKAKRPPADNDGANGPKGGPRDPDGGAPGAAQGGAADGGYDRGTLDRAQPARQARAAGGGASDGALEKKIAGEIRAIARLVKAGKNEEARERAEGLAGALQKADGKIPKLSAADILKLAYDQARPPQVEAEAEVARAVQVDASELDKQLVNRVDWENFCEVYGIDPENEELIDQMKLTARKTIRGDKSARASSKSVFSQLDRKTAKFRSDKHLSLALVDVVSKRSDNEKLIRPVKMKPKKGDA